MTSGISIEQMFAVDYRDRIQEKIRSLSSHITINPLPQEEYLVLVGEVRAYTLALEEFEELSKKVFARNL